jgi:hypothetical protein
MDDEFGVIYRGSVEPAHEIAGTIGQGLFHGYPQGHACLTGHASEITRCAYYWNRELHPDTVTVETLLRYTTMDDNAFARRHFTAWLDDAREVERRFGILVMDLFYWEQRVGVWAASGAAEWDIIHDRFPAFSCRELLLTLLGTDWNGRGWPDYPLFVRLITRMWPDALREPMNPVPKTWRDVVRSVLTATRTVGIARAAVRVLRRATG